MICLTATVASFNDIRRFPLTQFLYMAQALGANKHEHKVGQTSRLLSRRKQELSGQTDQRFEMVDAFVTLNAPLAEAFAFQELDTLGLRKYPGTLKELVVCKRAMLQGILQRAARKADTAHKARGLDSVAAYRAKAALTHGQETLTSKNKFWGAVLQAPVTSRAKQCSVQQLLQAGLRDPVLRRRAEKLGISLIARSESKVEFEILWPIATDVVNWLTARNKAVPPELFSRFYLNYADPS